MKRKILFLLLCAALGLPGEGNAQVSLNIFKKKTRVKLTPVNKSYKLEGEDIALQEGFFNDNERWVVFSDRNKNPTYKQPGSEAQLKMIGFMDACYVIGKKGDYFELVKYDARLIKVPENGFIDKKGADYLGWIHKSRLLLWRNALKENNTKFYIKAITCLKNEEIISTLPRFAVQDSLLLYSTPALKDTTGKCGMEQLCYIFKQSDDGKQYLVGHAPQLTPENRKEIISGWISRDLVKVWGTRLFFTLNNRDSLPAASDHIPFYTPADTTHSSLFYAYDREKVSNELLENIFPVQQSEQLQDTTEILKTGILTDVLDRSENEVINVLGKPIKYPYYKKLMRAQQNTNIVFVVDGGRENGKYMPNVLTVIQNLELYFDSAPAGRKFRYGAVVYKDNLGGSCRMPALPLTSDYASVVRFFNERQKETGSCNNDTIAQAVFPGVVQAAKMLKDVKNETNIIVLIGAAGNNMESAGYADVISHLSYVNARMLIFQTHSIPHPSYNDFVIQSKNLVLRSSVNISELKKEKLVDLADVLNNPSFSLTAGDSGIYYLNYPATSMTQGYVMFPDKGEMMQPVFLERGLDSLLKMTEEDNMRVERSLKRYFNTIGVRNTRLLSPYNFYYPASSNDYLPVPFLRSYAFTTQPFYVPALVPYKGHAKESLNPVQFGVLVSAAEYEQIIHILFELAGAYNYEHVKRRTLYNHLYDITTGTLREKKILIDEHVNNLSLSGMLEALTGYRSTVPEWENCTLRSVKYKRNPGKNTAIAFMRKCNKQAMWLQENINNARIRLFNNGETYYWLTPDCLP